MLYIPAFDTRRISPIIDPPDHSVPQHLQALGLSSPVHTASPTSLPRPHLKQRVHTRTRNTANPQVRLLKEQNRTLVITTLDHLKSSHNKLLLVDIAMDSSSVCVRKIRMRMVEENSRNLFLTLLIKSPLLIENICTQISGENFLMELEKLAPNPLKNLRENSTQTPKFIGLEKLAVGIQVAVGRPSGRPANGHFSDR